MKLKKWGASFTNKLFGLLGIVLASMSFSSCSNKADKDATMQRYYVDVNYDNDLNVYSLNTGDFTISNDMNFYSKTNNKKISNCIVGDYLEVYYDDSNNINKIVVDEAGVIELQKVKNPGDESETPHLISAEDDNTIYLKYDDIKNAMNQESTISKLKEIVDDSKLYGVYRKEDVEEGCIYNILGLYSYPPRSN